MVKNHHSEEINPDDLAPEITESYGTGVKDMPGYNIGGRTLRQRRREYTHTSPEITGGDVDAYWQQEDTVGDEAVGGTAPTPDQNVTDEIGEAVGLPMNDKAFLHTNDILERRDDSRWELDPMSSDDYSERKD
ncbi:DUF6335 family protein [Nodularia spumigena CS-584]|jgi:hypothetical protein|uniref:Uncharacterized protein n=2 Tax=Nodularia spumigena TaxID=70799 RepID=A0A2S0Q6S4_NODSP|nr:MULTISPECIES: DUF6335 family protein [Cyanophyceae]MDB9357138.1 DUF6335 family protein [Nodularia spumigena CS-587/03]AHJ27689.1 Enolase [Nodularia spumigena CCY9414]AVZ30094.1 hypothetical protein BMF81_01299 [Nodularia spumigena UHCC 0039]EAW46430.1 hypothetical protein N9414_06894 [Nodularia spumigena CCY9414]MDB9304485.1 DUF6335 family protein [Nodularia spumigena CS-591/12]